MAFFPQIHMFLVVKSSQVKRSSFMQEAIGSNPSQNTKISHKSCGKNMVYTLFLNENTQYIFLQKQ